MHLELAFGTNWLEDEVGAARVYTAPGFALVPDLFFEVFPVVPRTRAVGDTILLHDAPLDAIVRREPAERAATVTGWPVNLHEARFHVGDSLHEIRLLAHYELLVLAGFALVRVTNEQRLAQRRAQILELLTSARLVLEDDTPAAISDLWEMR